MPTLEALVAERTELMARVGEIDKQIRVIKEDAIRKEHGVFVGCVVIHGGFQYCVTRIDVNFARPLLYGRMIRKNGDVAKIEKYIGLSWELDKTATQIHAKDK